MRNENPEPIRRTGRAKYTNELGGTTIRISTHGYTQLFELEGADLSLDERSNSGVISVMHPHGQDFEHDAAYLVRLDIYGAKVEHMNLGAREFKLQAFLRTAHYYPDGVTPEEEPCTNEHCVGEYAHPFVEYLPPEQEYPRNVPVEIWVNMSNTGTELGHYVAPARDETSA